MDHLFITMDLILRVFLGDKGPLFVFNWFFESVLLNENFPNKLYSFRLNKKILAKIEKDKSKVTWLHCIYSILTLGQIIRKKSDKLLEQPRVKRSQYWAVIDTVRLQYWKTIVWISTDHKWTYWWPILPQVCHEYTTILP